MNELADCHIEILKFLREHHREYTFEQLITIQNEKDVRDLFNDKPNYITFLFDDYNRKDALGELTGEGKAALDKAISKEKAEQKEDKRWKDTRRMAWISIGISIIAVIVACFT